MSAAKVSVSIDAILLRRLDHLVDAGTFASRSQAIQMALEEKVSRIDGTRLAHECAQLDPAEEQAFAEEGFASKQRSVAALQSQNAMSEWSCCWAWCRRE